MEKEIEELKKRIEELEKRPQFVPIYPPINVQPQPNFYNPNLHYHGTIPCYANTCVWSGTSL